MLYKIKILKTTVKCRHCDTKLQKGTKQFRFLRSINFQYGASYVYTCAKCIAYMLVEIMSKFDKDDNEVRRYNDNPDKRSIRKPARPKRAVQDKNRTSANDTKEHTQEDNDN